MCVNGKTNQVVRHRRQGDGEFSQPSLSVGLVRFLAPGGTCFNWLLGQSSPTLSDGDVSISDSLPNFPHPSAVSQVASRRRFHADLPVFVDRLAALPRTRDRLSCPRVVVTGDFFTRFSPFFMEGVPGVPRRTRRRRTRLWRFRPTRRGSSSRALTPASSRERLAAACPWRAPTRYSICEPRPLRLNKSGAWTREIWDCSFKHSLAMLSSNGSDQVAHRGACVMLESSPRSAIW